MTITRYTGQNVCPDTANAVLARLAFAGVAEYAILPVQDALNLGNEARMNTPGIAAGNWDWRLTPEQLTSERLSWLREYAGIYGRLPVIPTEDAEIAEPFEYSSL
jgi:4-alpha-glucanotransferase